MPADHANRIIDEAIDRILNGKGSTVTLLEVVQSRNSVRISSFLHAALAPVIGGMEDDLDAVIEQRNHFANKIGR